MKDKFAIFSILIGSLSILPMLGILSPFALLFGIFAIIKKQGKLAIIGLTLSIISILTSPSLWLAANIALSCLVNSNDGLCKSASDHLLLIFHKK